MSEAPRPELTEAEFDELTALLNESMSPCLTCFEQWKANGTLHNSGEVTSDIVRTAHRADGSCVACGTQGSRAERDRLRLAYSLRRFSLIMRVMRAEVYGWRRERRSE